jgi:hypothetical protein
MGALILWIGAMGTSAIACGGDDAPAAASPPTRAASEPDWEEQEEEEPDEELESSRARPRRPAPDPIELECRAADFASDPRHCGACRRPCADTEVCSGGECKASCDEGLAPCGRSCVDLDGSRDHCGRCDRPCAIDACDEGFCAVTLSACFQAGPNCAVVCAAEGGRAEGIVRQGEMLDLASPRSTDPAAVTFVSTYASEQACRDTPRVTGENDPGRTLGQDTEGLFPKWLRCPCTFDPPAEWAEQARRGAELRAAERAAEQAAQVNPAGLDPATAED